MTSIPLLTPSLSGIGGIQRSALVLSDSGDYSGVPIDATGNGRLAKIVAAVVALKRVAAFDPARPVLVWHVNLLPLMLPLMSTRSVVCYFHGIEVWRPMGALQRVALRRCRAIAHNSEHTWRQFITMNDWADGLDHTLVPLGVGKARSSPDRGFERADGVITGRLERREDYKGHRELISVWPDVLLRIPKARLHVVGQGNLLPELRNSVAALGLLDAVIFHERCSDEDRDELIRASSALLMPSRGEGFGLAYLEAMSMGRPCLVSDSDAGLEVVHPPDCGISVNPRDRAQLLEGVCRLLTPGAKWTQMSTCSTRRHAEFYTAQAFVDRMSAEMARISSS